MFDYGKAAQREARQLAPVIYGRLINGIYTAVRVPLVLVIYLEKLYKDRLNIEYIGNDDNKPPYKVTLKGEQ